MLRTELVLFFLASCATRNTPVAVAPVAELPPPVSPIAPAIEVKATLPPPPDRVPDTSAPDTLVHDVLATGGDAVRSVLATPERYRFQVVYADVSGKKLVRHGFRADAEYFFPASSMKVPIALALYDRVPKMQKPWLTRDATLRIGPEPVITTLARETWRALIVSDNASANRLLGFVGHRELHETLWALGMKSARVHTGFQVGSEPVPAEVSPKIEIVKPGGDVDVMPARKSDLVLPPTNAPALAIGKAHIDDGKRVEGPLAFDEKNAMRLAELQDALVRIVRPDLASATSTPDLDYARQALGTLASESGLAGYSRNVVADYELSPFLRGLERVRPRGQFELYAKVGQAFGFLTANAYVVDKKSSRAFFLIATIYANPDETMNDDVYAYDTIAFPVLADVAEAFAKHAFPTP